MVSKLVRNSQTTPLCAMRPRRNALTIRVLLTACIGRIWMRICLTKVSSLINLSSLFGLSLLVSLYRLSFSSLSIVFPSRLSLPVFLFPSFSSHLPYRLSLPVFLFPSFSSHLPYRLSLPVFLFPSSLSSFPSPLSLPLFPFPLYNLCALLAHHCASSFSLSFFHSFQKSFPKICIYQNFFVPLHPKTRNNLLRF